MTSLVIMTIALITGVTVWWVLIQRLQTKPWVEKGIAERSVTTMPPARVGLRLFFGTMTSIFGVSMVAYLMRMSHSHGGGDWQRPRTLSQRDRRRNVIATVTFSPEIL